MWTVTFDPPGDHLQQLLEKLIFRYHRHAVAMGVGLVLFWPALFFGGVARRRLADVDGALDLFVANGAVQASRHRSGCLRTS